MITPATASTGTTALTPISGVSAAVRITPVPNPPMPPMMAAPSASSATAASVVASRSNLGARRHRARAPVGVDGDVGQRGLGDLHHPGVGGPALGIDLDRHRDGGVADVLDVDVEGKQDPDLHRLLEGEFLHRHGGDAAARE